MGGYGTVIAPAVPSKWASLRPSMAASGAHTPPSPSHACHSDTPALAPHCRCCGAATAGGMRRGAGVHPWDWTVPSCVQPLALTRSLMRRMRASFPQQVPRVAAACMSCLSRSSRLSCLSRMSRLSRPSCRHAHVPRPTGRNWHAPVTARLHTRTQKHARAHTQHRHALAAKLAMAGPTPARTHRPHKQAPSRPRSAAAAAVPCRAPQYPAVAEEYRSTPSTPKVPPHYPRNPDRTLKVPLQYPAVLPP